MIELNILDYIYRELSLEEQKVAIEFVRFLRDNYLSFYKDNCTYWKDKIYYWVKLDDDCICFIAIKNPDEKMNHWTVWSENMGSEWLESSIGDDKVKEVAWNYANHCCHCGSCGGGEKKIIFGKEFDDICGCTFRIDNPRAEDLLFLKRMVEIRINEVRNKS